MINIYKEYVKKYIHMLTEKDIKTYAKLKNIKLDDKEVVIIYKFIITHYEDLLEENTECFKELSNIRPDLLKELITLYNESKIKYFS